MLLFGSLALLLSVLLSVAFLTVVERVVLSGIQRRIGPRVVGVYGLLQAFSDGGKLLTKGVLAASGSWSVLYFASPVLVFASGLLGLLLLPLDGLSALLPGSFGVLLLLVVVSLGVYGVLLGGWSSGSQYAFLGGVRSASQMLSYEVGMAFLLLLVSLVRGSMDFALLSTWRLEGSFGTDAIALGLWLVCVVAELNRHPFDLPEAESELVSGYNVEYSGAGFVLFFLGEYAGMVQASVVTWALWGIGIGLDTAVVSLLVFFVALRAGLPRYRFDQLLAIGWCVAVPLSFGLLCFAVLPVSSV
jgi:NADH-quinone oxidoreductase subunit H